MRRIAAVAQFLSALVFIGFSLSASTQTLSGWIRMVNFALLCAVALVAARQIWRATPWGPYLSITVALCTGVAPLGFVATALETPGEGLGLTIASIAVLLQLIVVSWSLFTIWPRPGPTG